MRAFILVSLFFVYFSQLFGQDSTGYLQQFRNAVKEKNYATAHLILQSAIEQNGFKPEYVTDMVENALLHHFKQKDYQVFYLRDSLWNWDNYGLDTSMAGGIVSLRYPDRLLKKVIRDNPAYGKAYKLLGDYYELYLTDFGHSSLLDLNAVRMVEDKVFKNYKQAASLGIENAYMNRWLGDYYLKLNQLDMARQFYLKNVKNKSRDPVSFFRMGEIHYQEKQYSQAYNYAQKALNEFPASEIYLRYDALRLSAKSLFHLGEEGRFLSYLEEAIQLLPDEQEAYIDLVGFYSAEGDSVQVKKYLRLMLLNNPYDINGYNYFEKMVMKFNLFKYSENLFEEMIFKFENSDEVMGNIYQYRGNILHHRNRAAEAQKMWEISRSYYSRYLPEDSSFLKKVGNLSKRSAAEPF